MYLFIYFMQHTKIENLWLAAIQQYRLDTFSAFSFVGSVAQLLVLCACNGSQSSFFLLVETNFYGGGAIKPNLTH